MNKAVAHVTKPAYYEPAEPWRTVKTKVSHNESEYRRLHGTAMSKTERDLLAL